MVCIPDDLHQVHEADKLLLDAVRRTVSVPDDRPRIQGAEQLCEHLLHSLTQRLMRTIHYQFRCPSISWDGFCRSLR